MDAVLVGVGAVALAEGVRFLYAQAGEVLRVWRDGRASTAAPPEIVATPSSVEVRDTGERPEAPDDAALAVLDSLRQLLAPMARGEVTVEDPAARQAVANARDLIESMIGASITFAGEPTARVRVERVEVVTQRVAGQVTGLRADLARLDGAAFGEVRVRTGDVDDGGTVTGVDLS